MPVVMAPTALASGLVIALCLYLLLELKTSRPDGTLIDVHPYRRVMFHIMPTRNESVVYFDSWVDSEALVSYLEEAKERFGGDLSRAVAGAVSVGMKEAPSMNHFVVGHRKYARNKIWVSMRMLSQSGGAKERLLTIKECVPSTMTFRDLCESTDARLESARDGTDRQVGGTATALGLLPAPASRLLARLALALDYFNLLPSSVIEHDPLFCSLLIANPSRGDIEPGYHHLYEWGNCPLILMIGRVEDRPMKVDERLVFRKQLHLRYAYDERIDDGLSARFGFEAVKRVLENPYAELGCLSEDGSDAVFLTAHAGGGRT